LAFAVSTYPHPLIAREGWPFILLALVAAVALTWLGWWLLAVVCWLLLVFIVQFFRDPPRVVGQSEQGAP